MSSYRWRKRASSKSSFSEELRKRPRKNAACAKAPSEREDVNTVVADAVRQIGAVLLKFAEKLEGLTKPMNKIPSEVYEGFTNLAEYSAEKRANGVCSIIESIISIEDETQRSTVIAYCVKRLVRGLSSNRQAARLGFAVALAELIRSIETVTVDDVLKQMEAILHVESTRGGRPYALGFVMGLLALVETREVVQLNDPLLPFLIRHVLVIHKKFGSCNFFFLQPLVSILEKSSHGGSSIVHPCVHALVKAALRSDAFCQFWTAVMSEFTSGLIKRVNFKGAFEIVDIVMQDEATAAKNLEVVLTPNYFASLLTCTAENSAIEKNGLESVRSSLAIHMENIQERLLKFPSAPMLNIFFDALLTSGSPLGQKTRLRLLDGCTRIADRKIVNDLFKKVQQKIKANISEIDLILLSKLTVRMFKNDNDRKLRFKILNFLIRSAFSTVDPNGENVTASAALKEKLTSAYFNILFHIFMANVSVNTERMKQSVDLLKTSVGYLHEGFESHSDDILNGEDVDMFSNAFSALHACQSALDVEQQSNEYTVWPLYCTLVFVLSSGLFDKRKPRKLLEELTKCGERLPAADESLRDNRVKVLIDCTLSLPDNVQHKCKALCLMVFSHLCPILRFDDLSPLFARLENSPENQEDSCVSEEESEEDFPSSQPTKMNGIEDSMEHDLKVIDITELEDLDVTDGLMDVVFRRSFKHEHGDESEQVVWGRYAPLELIRLFVTKSTDGVVLLRVLVELLKATFHWASNGAKVNDNCLFARSFRCLHEIRRRKLSFADPAAQQEASDVICAAVKTIFELSTSMPSVNRRKAALDDQLTKSLLYLLNQGRSLKTKHERVVRELSESLLMEQCAISNNASRAVSERLGAACFHALPMLARSAMEQDCDIHKRIQYLRVCTSVLSNAHSLTYLRTAEAQGVWHSFSEEMRKGFFLFHDIVFPPTSEGTVDKRNAAAQWDANYFLTLMELLLQLSKIARHVDLAALVDEDFLLRLRHFNRPKFWSQPQCKKIKARMRSCYPLGEHKFLANLYRALRCGSNRFEGFEKNR
ncbi:hypothetical protein M514_07152 [Trichuris suis]|uniref:Uncharacterized protein n=1 Tax=Trichuris suis TaxID=68888 RepID=A0A085NPG8_9BILA|nr:hypothetical protein M514_07152 [Trichuris suis]